MAVDPALIQKSLTLSADLIYSQIVTSGKLTDSTDYKRLKQILGSGDNKNIITPETAMTDIEKQSQIASGHPMPDADAAVTLFGCDWGNVSGPTKTDKPFTVDKTEDGAKICNTSPEKNYNIGFSIIVNNAGELYAFDIDEFNNNQTDEQVKNAKIVSIEINNESKEQYTLKSNYKITLKIKFGSFDALINRRPKMRSLGNPSAEPYTGACLLNLIYKFYDPTKQNLPRKITDMPDHEGFFITQKLTFNKNVPGLQEKITSIYGTSQLNKNYHVSYLKHSFEMFQNEENATDKNPPLDHYLTITYGAWETDGAEKPFVHKNIPQYAASIYRILALPQYSGLKADGTPNDPASTELRKMLGLDTLAKTQEKITEFNNKIQAYVRESNLTTKLSGSQKEKINKWIKEAKEELLKIKHNLKSLVTGVLVNNFDVYTITVPAKVVGTWSENNYIDNLIKNFSFSNLATATNVGMAAGSIIPGVGNALGAAIGAGSYIAYQLIASAFERETKTRDISADEIRKNFLTFIKTSIAPAKKGAFLALVKKANLKVAQEDGGFYDPAQLGDDERKQKVLGSVLKSVGYVEPDKDDYDTATYPEVPFILFRDIIKILTILDPTERTKILCLNHFFKISNTEVIPVNYAHFPISLELFLAWFYKDFLENEKAENNYDSELFFKNAYENLLKVAVVRGESCLKVAKGTAPTELRMTSTLHDDSKLLLIKAHDASPVILSLNTVYKDWSAELIKSQNIEAQRNFTGRPSSSGVLTKILVLSSIQDYNYFDFYKHYREKLDSLGLNPVSVPNTSALKYIYTYAFERYINRYHLIPCLTVGGTAIKPYVSFSKQNKNIKFERLDNANIEVSNFLQGAGLFRLQYQFSAEFFSYMFHFVDIGSLIFIAPPVNLITEGTGTTPDVTAINVTGFGGLYMLKGVTYRHIFNHRNGEQVAHNAELSTLQVRGTLVSYGEDFTKPATIELPTGRGRGREGKYEKDSKLEWLSKALGEDIFAEKAEN